MKFFDLIDRLKDMIEWFSLLRSEQMMTLILALIVISIPALRYRYLSVKESGKEHDTKERIQFFDGIKGLATIAVILIHVIFFFLVNSRGNTDFLNIFNNIIRFAVPLFFICNGILLKPYDTKSSETITKFYSKKITRIFIPYLIATLVTILYMKQPFVDFFPSLLKGRAQTPYYYIVVLTQFYMLYPILVAMKNRWWFLPASLGISLYSFAHLNSWYFYEIPSCLPYLYFFSYGLAHRDYFLNNKKDRNDMVYLLLVIAVYIFFTLVKTDYYYNMLYFYGVAVWSLLFLFQNTLTKKLYFNHLAPIGKLSFLIYLIHFPIVQILDKKFEVVNNIYVHFITVFLISTLISFYLAKLLSFLITAASIQLKSHSFK